MTPSSCPLPLSLSLSPSSIYLDMQNLGSFIYIKSSF